MRCIWDALMGAHRFARFFDRDRHTLALENLDKNHGGRHAAEIHGRAGPVE